MSQYVVPWVFAPCVGRSAAHALVEDAERVEGAGVADVRDELGEDGEQACAVVADVEVGGDVTGELRLAAAERGEHREGEQLPGGDVEAVAGEVVAEAVRREEPLDVLLVVGRIRVQGVDPVGADDLLLDGEALVVPALRGGGRLSRKRKRELDAALGEDVVGAWTKSKTLAMPTYGTAW
jgi:hypothetical protein